MARTDQIANEIATLMPMIARRILLSFFQSINLTQTQFFTIVTIAEESPIRQSDLRKKMNIAAPTVTGIIDRLVRLGYVKRIPDQKDRRVMHVDLTAKGRNLAKKLKLTLKSKWKMLLTNLPQQDQEHYVRILRTIRGNIK